MNNRGADIRDVPEVVGTCKCLTRRRIASSIWRHGFKTDAKPPNSGSGCSAGNGIFAGSDRLSEAPDGERAKVEPVRDGSDAGTRLDGERAAAAVVPLGLVARAISFANRDADLLLCEDLLSIRIVMKCLDDSQLSRAPHHVEVTSRRCALTACAREYL